MAFKEKLFEGKYIYSLDGKEYSQEDFLVQKEDKMQGNYFYFAEVLSRVKTGEFLRIQVNVELSNGFDPLEVSIKRSLGGKESFENYSINQKDKNVSYSFRGLNGEHQFAKVVGGRPQFATPCFAMSTLMINTKKIDPVHRTPYTIITSNNIWEYEGPFSEREVYLELQDLEPVPLVINERELNATHCKMLQVDDKGTVLDEAQDIFLSKYNYLPYKAVFTNGVVIEVDTLKSFENLHPKV